jgi:Uma2 family endonuclease
VSIDAYLGTTFGGPDRELVRGEIVERSMPDLVHSGVQARLVAIILALTERCRLFAFPELRLRLADDVVRVPDVTIFRDAIPTALVPAEPPHCVIEIVSRDDRYTDVLEKLDEYARWGVPHVWVVDPWLGSLSVYDGTGLRRLPQLELPGTGRPITLAELVEGLPTRGPR